MRNGDRATNAHETAIAWCAAALLGALVVFSLPARAEDKNDPPDIAGTWESKNPPFTYSISTPNSEQFSWTVIAPGHIKETCDGTIMWDPARKSWKASATWRGNFSSGSAAGTISIDERGRPQRIVWDNGVEFTRKDRQ